MIHPLVKLAYTLIGLALLYYIFPHLVPFFVALALAVLFEPVVCKIQEILKGKRIAAVTFNFVVFMLFVGGLGFLGSTKVINQTLALFQQLPAFALEVGKGMERIILRTQVIFEDLPAEMVQSLEQAIRDTVTLGGELSNGAAAVIGTAKAIPNAFVILIVTVVSFYLFSLQLPEVKAGFLKLFSDRAKEKVDIILMDVNRAVVGFVRAQFIISFITYFLILAGLLFLGIKYAFAIALLIVLVDVLPILGTGFIMIPWAAFLFIIDQQFTAIGIMVLYVFLIVLRRIIEPKILGQNIGLSPLTTVISMYVGFKVFSIAGIFIGPVICIVFKAMQKAGLFKEKIDF